MMKTILPPLAGISASGSIKTLTGIEALIPAWSMPPGAISKPTNLKD